MGVGAVAHVGPQQLGREADEVLDRGAVCGGVVEAGEATDRHHRVEVLLGHDQIGRAGIDRDHLVVGPPGDGGPGGEADDDLPVVVRPPDPGDHGGVGVVAEPDREPGDRTVGLAAAQVFRRRSRT